MLRPIVNVSNEDSRVRTLWGIYGQCMLPFNSSPQFNSLVEPPCITWKAKGCFWILHKIFKGQTSCTIILLGGVKFSLNQVFNFWSEVLYLIFGCPEWTLEIVGFEHWSDSCHWSVEFWDRPFFFYTFITVSGTFLCRHCTTTTCNVLFSWRKHTDFSLPTKKDS